MSKTGIVLTPEQLVERRKKIHRADEKSPIIVAPDAKDLQRVLQTGNICGGCAHWRLDQAQQDMIDQRFWERMLQEEKYRNEWFENKGSYGYCQHFEGRAIPFNAPATNLASDHDASLYNTKKGMEKVPCPMYKERKGSTMSISRSHTRGLEH